MTGLVSDDLPIEDEAKDAWEGLFKKVSKKLVADHGATDVKSMLDEANESERQLDTPI